MLDSRQQGDQGQNADNGGYNQPRFNNNQQGGYNSNNNQGGGYGNQGSNQGGYNNQSNQGGYGNGGNSVNQGFQSPKPAVPSMPAQAPTDLDDDLPF